MTDSKGRVVSVDALICRRACREGTVNGRLDVDSLGYIIGIEMLGLAWSAGVKPKEVQAAPPSGAAKRITYDADADALFVKLAEGNSSSQPAAEVSLSSIPQPTGAFVLRLAIEIPDSLQIHY